MPPTTIAPGTAAPLFDHTAPLPTGRLALEASAGTGKTWTIAAMVLRWVAEEGLAVEQLLVVTFTRAATAELRARIRRRLVDAHDHLDALERGGAPTPDDDVLAHLADVDAVEVARRRERVARALADFDAATITTIHGFCHSVLAAAGFQGEVDGGGRLVEEVDDLVHATTRDLLVAQWAEVPADEQHDRPTPQAAADVAAAVLRDPNVPVLPGPADDLEAGPAGLVRLAEDVRDAMARRKRQLGLVTFDDLLLRLRDSLRDPAAGPGIRASMRARYRVALVDEFQDTDPVQWEVLQALFSDRPMVLIGDPKQAIYRFRGADVHAYLDAVAADGTQARTLGTNHRSDDRLVRACNGLFAGTTFGDPRIAAHPVTSRHPDRLLFRDGPRAALEVRVSAGAGSADVHRDRIAADLAAEVTAVLADGATIADATGPGGRRPVRPGDLAVLVRSNAQADLVKSVLAEAGVHAVVNGVGSVLESPAAGDWQRLLEALERPSSSARVRAVAIGPMLGMTAREVAELDEDGDAALHERLHRWSRTLAEHGLATLVRTIHREARLAERMLAVRGGDRWLADFEHVAELLHAAAQVEHLGAAALLAWLVAQRARTDELPADQRARRLESDALAVQVLTIHRAKGLQFPIVFCPYVMSTGMWPRVPYEYRDPAVGGPVVHVGGPGQDEARRRSREDDLGEQLRLLYVALTRAEHRVVTWWFPFRDRVDSAFQKLLLCDDGEPRVAADRRAPKLPDGGDAASFDAAVARIGPDVAAWCEVPDAPRVVPWRDGARSATELVARRFTGRIDGTWRRASYTALTRPVAGREVGGVVHAPDAGGPVADEFQQDHGDAPLGAGVPGLPLPLGDQPAGAAFGTMVHHLLEHVDFRAPDPVAALREVRLAHRHAVRLDDPAGLDAGLAAALATPLGPALGGTPLSGVDRADRLDELDFELPLAPAATAHVALADVAALLREHLDPADPFRGYAADLEDRMLARRVHGWLAGSIDLVVRRRHEGRSTFHVLDHKTNRLSAPGEPPTTADYDGPALVAAMRHGHYVLQALLYQVALHRFLRWRLPDHDPEQDLGHVGYLFLRGMVGPDAPPAGAGVPPGTPCGVLAWRPPTALVVALSDLLDNGGRP